MERKIEMGVATAVASTDAVDRSGNIPLQRDPRLPGKRARRVVRTNSQGFTGFLPCSKAAGIVHYESINERNLFAFMERHEHAVVAFCEQPETFSWREPDGRHRTYTPDVLAILIDGRRIYREVKPAHQLQADPDLKGRLAAIHEQCANRGASYEIWTDEQIKAAWTAVAGPGSHL